MADGPAKLAFNFLGQLKPIAVEIAEHAPHGIIIGTGILGLFTMNIAVLILLLYFIELFLIQRGLAKSFAYLFPSVVGQSGFPYYPLFFIVGALTYLNSATIAFSDIYERIGGEYSTKVPMATLSSLLAIIIFFTYTVVTGKTGKMQAFGTFFFAVFVGLMMFLVHKLIFGIEGVNLLGVPILSSKTGASKPIYACGPLPAGAT